ncbi:type IV toxin-antitoxin system AbiEi family antitoxin [Marinobacter nanhaiticus D15-8W]|uniref:Uncharacterized protein n=1 Tax=Marinobacter nanhaiticus D15-8W TaxID=626887 RepID=N6WUR8_9GAMM|nr:type IV toxin-antitoxin system AbiEi family antitoxin [Marinobacter nanhaiticus]ENO14732.1 hypothetical protein J057_05256 [Marinobacter nanhaiticus D15-8W]BES69580.1 type IV toxin-antitoxin system AbiEi family antitoxin [Marinobacter nanhaiticus D15-8W]
MENPNAEVDLLEQALNVFNRETGLNFECDGKTSTGRDIGVDALLTLRPQNIQYNAQLKRWAQQANTGALIAQLNKLPEPSLLVADFINPNMADRLRESGVQFIDAAGNTYLNGNGLHIFIKGHRPLSALSMSPKATRAFNASGLKLVLCFLVDPDLVGQTYRAIAAAAGVSLGTIGWVINDLKAQGYIGERGKTKERRLKRPLALLDRWVEGYPEILLPSMELGWFQTPYQFPWKEIQASEFGGRWSGEVGAYLFDPYLSPARGKLYLPRERLKDVVLRHRLRKKSDGLQGESDTICIVEKFWHLTGQSACSNNPEVAPDILVYADLVATGDPRNLESAERLYGRIKDRLERD